MSPENTNNNDEYVAEQQRVLGGPVVPPEIFPEQSQVPTATGESASTPGDLAEREKAEEREAKKAEREAAKKS